MKESRLTAPCDQIVCVYLYEGLVSVEQGLVLRLQLVQDRQTRVLTDLDLFSIVCHFVDRLCGEHRT